MKHTHTILLALLLAACNGDDKPPPPIVQPSEGATIAWELGPIIGNRNYSPDVVWTGSGFTFPTAPPGVHGLTRNVGPIDGRAKITTTFTITGTGGFLEVDCGTPTCVPGAGQISLFIQRCGDDWSGRPETLSNRFYSPGLDLGIGQHEMGVSLNPDLWTNVSGQHDPAGFAATLASLCRVGLGFGRMFAMHGVYATGASEFYLNSFIVE